MTLEPHSMLAHYRLVDKIGEGGMGVVWRAVDTTLDREVAIKFLPDSFARDEERLARFEREAKLLAALNHPNIAGIYGLHSTPEARFLSMELVAGEDLAERLARGPLPQEEALRVAVQVASALEAAHETGIIHRDLKPANVKLAPDGRVKVLDFGLAKAAGPASGSPSASPSLSPTITHAGTMAGTILGTAAYMSPEQAKGKAVDRRADIWAFGALLYECLCGRRLFEGETISETLAAVIMKEVRWDALPEGTPPRVRRLLRRCMQRDPQSRLRDIGDARLVLEETLAGADRDEAESTVGRGGRAGRSGGWILAAVLALAGIATGFGAARLMHAPAAHAPLVKFDVSVESLGAAAIAPDGKRLVFISGGLLHVRDLDRLEARELAGTDGAAEPFWSPDGAWIGYGANGKLWKVPASGGAPSMLCELPDGHWGTAAGAAWLPNGSIVFTTGDSGLLSVNDQGGDPASFLDLNPETEDDFHNASGLPDGRGVVFVLHRKGSEGVDFDTIEAVSGKTRKIVIRMEGQSLRDPVYSPSGHVLFQRGPTNPGVWAVPFSLDTLEATGAPFLVAAGGDDPSVSSGGTLVYAQGALDRPRQLVRASRDGRTHEPIGPLAETSTIMALSPDGSRVVIEVEEHGKRDLWIQDLIRGTRTRLTFEGGLMPAWSPDGTRIVFTRGAMTTDFKLMQVAADGTGQPEELGPGWFPSFTPDGKTLVYTAITEAGPAGLLWMPLNGEHKPTQMPPGPSSQFYSAVSPDGRYVAYGSTESGPTEIYLRPFPAGEGKWQVSVNGGMWPRWSRSGDRLYYARGDDLMEVPVKIEGGAPRLGQPARVLTRKPSGVTMPYSWPPAFDVSPDGKSFLFLEAPDSGPVVARLGVVLNWYEEFRR